jgi:four helix bundle protein
MLLVEKVFILTNKLPTKEQFGLISQINRSAISIPSNIAEGSAILSGKEYRYFLSISLGSAFELETQILISQRLGYLNKVETETIKVLELINEIEKMLSSLMRILTQNSEIKKSINYYSPNT